EFVGILPAQGGDFIPQPSRRLEACVPRDFAILLSLPLGKWKGEGRMDSGNIFTALHRTGCGG
ncbi:MAG: hypothetical protein FWC43_05715, partial [Planctomycetaceae bacterium]|nr:hypothetical protein [Planctomycetaceae bacterium]